MRFVFTPPADHAAGLLTLPWSEPLAEWQDERLVEIRQRGISRHVVRFVYDDGELYALKELNERLARREYRLLRLLRGRLPPAEVFSEVLEHRWYMSEAAGLDVGTTAATKDYIENVLPAAPDPLNAGEATGPMEAIGPLGIGEPPGGSVPA
jgi:hypothetical protein